MRFIEVGIKKKKSHLNKKSGGQRVAFTIATAIMLVICGSYVISLLWAAFAATKTHSQIVIEPFKWHNIWNFKNFIDVFSFLEVRGTNMLGMIANSLWLTFGSAALSLGGTALLAYALTKFNFVGRKFLLGLNFVVIILPIVGALPSQYKMYYTLNMIDSPLILMASIGSFGSNMLICMAFFRNLSDEYREAAIIDGAGEYRILFQIIVPLVKGPIVALFVMSLVNVWNDYSTALLFLPNRPTLSTGIYLFEKEMTNLARMDLLMAATVLSALPPLALYIIFNKTILTNVSIGGIKE